METASRYDCQACGACCFAGENYVQLFEEDLVQLSFAGVRHLAVRSTRKEPRPGEDDGTLFMAMKDGHCAAFEGERGHASCSIYLDRPLLCRVFEPGSPSCLEARVKAGFPEAPAGV